MTKAERLWDTERFTRKRAECRPYGREWSGVKTSPSEPDPGRPAGGGLLADGWIGRCVNPRVSSRDGGFWSRQRVATGCNKMGYVLVGAARLASKTGLTAANERFPQK